MYKAPISFKPFLLPDGQIVYDTWQLEQAMRYLNPLMLKDFKKCLPWYITVQDVGQGLKIEVFKPEIVIEIDHKKMIL